MMIKWNIYTLYLLNVGIDVTETSQSLGGFQGQLRQYGHFFSFIAKPSSFLI